MIMSRFKYGVLYLSLLTLAVAFLAACSSNDSNEAVPTPPGIAEGQPSFVFLWNAP